MNPPQDPVKPPPPPRVPKDHVPDAGKMETPSVFDIRCMQERIQELERELAATNARIADLEAWIRGLNVVDENHTEHRQWCDDIGSLYPGQCAYIGPQKPEGLR